MHRTRGTRASRNLWKLFSVFFLLSFILMITAGTGSAATSALDPNSSYYFTITSNNQLGVESVNFNVVGLDDPAPPMTVIADPADGSAASGMVSINVNAPLNVEIAKIQFFANGLQIAETATSPLAFSWDTSTLARGDYAIAVKAFDVAGNEQDSADLTVTVAGDITPPSVSLETPTNNSVATGSVMISASANDNVLVTSVELYIDAVLVQTNNQRFASYNWNTLAESNGDHVLSAKAYDAAGNLGQSTSVTVTVFNDTLAPSVAIAAPLAGSTVAGTLAVSAGASDNVAVAKVEFYVNGALQTTLTSAPYIFNWNTAAVANGTYTLGAKAYDAAGNIGQSANVAVTVFNDTIAPSVSLSSPANGGSAGGMVTVSANASDDVGVTKIEFYLNGVLQSTATSAPYSFNWNTAAVANGSYTLGAKAYDAAGNIGQSPNVTVTVFNDTLAPTVAIVAPSVGSTVGGMAAVTVSASDNVGVTRVEFYVNGVLQSTLTSAPYNFNWNTATVANGPYALSARAYDAAGNVGISSNVSVTAFNDAIAPVVSFAAPTNSSTVSGMVAVTIGASDNVGVTRVEYYLNGALQGTLTAAPYSFNWNTAAVANGTCTLSAMAYDSAGNVGSAAVTVSVKNPDTTAPVITSISPDDGSKIAGNVTVSASATDNVAVTKMQLYIDNMLQLETSNSSFSWIWNAKNYPKGTAHVIMVKSYDAANNMNYRSVTVYK